MLCIALLATIAQVYGAANSQGQQRMPTLTEIGNMYRSALLKKEHMMRKIQAREEIYLCDYPPCKYATGKDRYATRDLNKLTEHIRSVHLSKTKAEGLEELDKQD